MFGRSRVLLEGSAAPDVFYALEKEGAGEKKESWHPEKWGGKEKF